MKEHGVLQENDKPVNFMIILGGLIAGQIGLSLYLPSLPLIQMEWHLTTAQTQLTLSVYFIMFGVSQLFYGTLSDHFGRRPLVLLGLFIAALGAFWSSQSDSFYSLLAGRFFQGLGAGALPVLARASVKDMYTDHRFGKAVSMLSMTASISLALSPFAGSWLSQHFGWRYDFYFITAFTSILLFTSWQGLLETHTDKTRGGESFSLIKIFSQYQAVIKNGCFIYYALFILLGYLTLILCLENAPFFFTKKFSISIEMTSYWMLVLPVSYIVGILIQRHLYAYLSIQHLFMIGILILMAAGIVFVGQVVLGIGSIVSLLTGFFLAGCASAFIFLNATAGMLKASSQTGTAAALSGVLQMVGTSLLAALVSFLHWNTIEGLGWVFLSVAALAGLSLLIFFVSNIDRDSHKASMTMVSSTS